jgi:hypothetical protein
LAVFFSGGDRPEYFLAAINNPGRGSRNALITPAQNQKSLSCFVKITGFYCIFAEDRIVTDAASIG